jgi:hypothetical protein
MRLDVCLVAAFGRVGIAHDHLASIGMIQHNRPFLMPVRGSLFIFVYRASGDGPYSADIQQSRPHLFVMFPKRREGLLEPAHIVPHSCYGYARSGHKVVISCAVPAVGNRDRGSMNSGHPLPYER